MAVLAGDPGADSRLCEFLRPRLLNFASSILQGPDAEDAVHDSLIALIRNLKKRKEFTGDFLAYARIVVKNRCLHFIRRRASGLEARDVSIEGRSDATLTDSLEELLIKEAHELLHRALAQLSAMCRDLLVNFYFHKIPIKDLVKDPKATTVQTYYYRKRICLERLIKIFKKLSGDTS